LRDAFSRFARVRRRGNFGSIPLFGSSSLLDCHADQRRIARRRAGCGDPPKISFSIAIHSSTILYTLIVLALAFMGGGRYSLDAALFGQSKWHFNEAAFRRRVRQRESQSYEAADEN